MMEYYAFSIAIVAVVYSIILIEPDMLLWPLYSRLQNWTLAKYNKYPNEVYWLKPLIGCVLCVTGQWCFWGYLIIYFNDYNLFQHLYFTALGIFLSAILKKIYLWSKI